MTAHRDALSRVARRNVLALRWCGACDVCADVCTCGAGGLAIGSRTRAAGAERTPGGEGVAASRGPSSMNMSALPAESDKGGAL
jgi:hypothetical protein